VVHITPQEGDVLATMTAEKGAVSAPIEVRGAGGGAQAAVIVVEPPSIVEIVEKELQ
jgi:hypothetical protein